MGVFHVKMLPILFAIGVLSASVSSSFLPQWQELNCEANHKYLFADVTHTWQDAREECALYGGWLLSIDSMQEQNCLLKYAKTNVQSGWFWHDATDSETEGVYVHAKDKLDLLTALMTLTICFWAYMEKMMFEQEPGVLMT